jgi:hypothetical protein
MKTYKRDLTGDGMVGSIHYFGGHVVVHKSLLRKALDALIVAVTVLLLIFVLGNYFNVNWAQTGLQTIIAGRK